MASVSAVNPTQTAALFNGNHPSVNKNQTGGFEADFVSSVNADYQCPICQLPFREPVQTRDCGHRFCESCLEPILRWVLRELLGLYSIKIYLIKVLYVLGNRLRCAL